MLDYQLIIEIIEWVRYKLLSPLNPPFGRGDLESFSPPGQINIYNSGSPRKNKYLFRWLPPFKGGRGGDKKPWQTKAINFALINILAFTLTISLNQSALGQINNLVSPDINPNNLPNGEIVYAPIKLDDRELFQIAAMGGSGLKVGGKNPASPLEMRVKMYEDNLEQILSTGFDAASLNLSLEKSGDRTLIVATDAELLKNQPVIAVTPLDAQIYGLSESELSLELTDIIKTALVRARRERSGDYLQSQLWLSGGILLAGILISVLLWFWQKRLFKKYEQRCEKKRDLKQRLAEKNLEQIPENSEDSLDLEAAEKQLLLWERKQNINGFLGGLLQISQIILLYGAVAWILGRFPQTRWLHNWLVTKGAVVAIALSTYLAIKASAVLIDWLLKKWLHNQPTTPASSSRITARITTVSQVIKGVLAVVLASIGIVWSLHKLHIPIAPILAGAGIIGFAISFSSQNLIRDVINGAFILLEDQYALGDIINVGHASGVVEKMNLRMSQLRGIDGSLSTVPNSSIITVQNLTKDWSRINFTVEVGYESDPTEAMEIVKRVSQELDKDSEWGERVLEPADVLGVNNLSHNGIEIVIWIRTLPGLQWSVGREFRRRLKIAFDDAGIAIGVPQRSLFFQGYPPMFGEGFDDN